MTVNYETCWAKLSLEVAGWRYERNSLVSADVLLSYMHAIEDHQRLIDELERVKSLQETPGGDGQGS